MRFWYISHTSKVIHNTYNISYLIGLGAKIIGEAFILVATLCLLATQSMRRFRKFCQSSPTLTSFFFNFRREDTNTTNSKPYWPASEKPSKKLFSGVQLMAQHEIWTSIAKEPYIFVIFRGGGSGSIPPPPPSESVHDNL